MLGFAACEGAIKRVGWVLVLLALFLTAIRVEALRMEGLDFSRREIGNYSIAGAAPVKTGSGSVDNVSSARSDASTFALWKTFIMPLVQSKKAMHAAVFGHDGVMWATTSEDFKPTQKEMILLMNAFYRPDQIQINGFTVRGQKFVALHTTDRRIYGRSINGGILFIKTGKTLLVAMHSVEALAGQMVNAVERLAEYMVSTGY